MSVGENGDTLSRRSLGLVRSRQDWSEFLCGSCSVQVGDCADDVAVFLSNLYRKPVFYISH